jgi:hypothetical protein
MVDEIGRSKLQRAASLIVELVHAEEGSVLP